MNPTTSASTLWKITAFAASAILALPAHSDELLDRIPEVFERAAGQYDHMLSMVESDTKIPRTIKEDGSVLTVGPKDWTSGFFPGSLWFLHEYDGSEKWKDKALDYTRRLEVIRHFKDNHDGGFMLGCSYGNALRLAPSDEFREVLQDAATALGTRYVPSLGMIRSWDNPLFICPVIIDNMMNLELLTWAAKNGGDQKLQEIAVSHADKTLANHFRPDGSAYHVVDYDPETGWIRAIYGWQGADVQTPWARGQAWALYGFTMMFRETGKQEYLKCAENVAQFLMNHPNLPEDLVPYWDFGVEPGADVPRDASAAAIMASALVELSTLSDEGAAYRDFAAKQLLSLSKAPYLAEPKTNGGFILTQSTGHLPKGSEIDVPLVYADYYYLEALLRYRALLNNETRLSFGEVK
ncbi:MAG: glycoside hydrolase family 88 protein [Akkermansiaceae bacterium]|jgi:unsaturated chondroitin disaccharide hydrolase|nr:glycoside hydrolase family 88 protein [Akkermansiaceae bacterium]MDP4847520.1 glycoside hydrolase family 88 protein [Akkermansiaceae bacterium]